MNPLEGAVQKSLGTLPSLKVDVLSSFDSVMADDIQKWLNLHSNDTVLFISQSVERDRFILTTIIYRAG